MDQQTVLLNLSQGQILILTKLEQLSNEVSVLKQENHAVHADFKRLEERFQLLWERLKKGKANIHDLEKVAEATADNGTSSAKAQPSNVVHSLTAKQVQEAFSVRDRCEARAKTIFKQMRETFPKAKIPSLVCIKTQGWRYWPAHVLVRFTHLPLTLIYHFKDELDAVAKGTKIMVCWFTELTTVEQDTVQKGKPENYFFLHVKREKKHIKSYEEYREQLITSSKKSRHGYNLASAVEQADNMFRAMVTMKKENLVDERSERKASVQLSGR
eukprot:CAMPEP_0184694390 /NCGR_PEP_ID=MMETSP0313-20130426/2375_1 /TAXON_ID=2792 /ORGANISM="Porphyridium aerugineum, Strain SAG 1380-2" /LENGTH=270 /DNA_ID=CAMNT_0027152681 /DNA_START=955 /DNA_END=1767 /DNA_ORIENTATION=+